MIIELQRALTPELVEEECGLCGVRFRPESVIAWCNHAEPICPECVRYLGERNPERFPSIQEYRAAIERHPQPVWASVEEVMRVEAEDLDAFWKVYAESCIG